MEPETKPRRRLIKHHSAGVKSTPPVVLPTKVQKPTYADNEINEILVGYIRVHSQLWDHIPSESHIRYIKRDDGAGLSERDRFKPGGFVKYHFTGKNSDKNNDKMFMLESTLGGDKCVGTNYSTYAVSYAEIETLWKKYDSSAYVEIHLIYNSLAQKKQEIETLKQENEALKARVKNIEDILRKAIGQ